METKGDEAVLVFGNADGEERQLRTDCPVRSDDGMN